MTVPSPRPMARWATVAERATVVTYEGQIDNATLEEIKATNWMWPVIELDFCRPQ